MGRVRTVSIKKISKKLINDYHDKFNNNFEHNKKVLNELNIEFSNKIRNNKISKKLRNKIAGYITHLIRQEEVMKCQKENIQDLKKQE